MPARSREHPSPVVLLHSGGLSSRQWERLAVELAEAGYAVHAPDFLGHGTNTATVPKPMRFTADVDACGALLQQIGQPVHLVGHSYGGFIALNLARRHADLVRSLALYEPVALGVLAEPADCEGLADLQRLTTSPIFRDESALGTERWFEVFVDFWSGPGAWTRLAPAARRSFLATGPSVAEGVVSLADDRTPLTAYRDVTAPTLLMQGECSPVTARRVAHILCRGLPSARLTEVPGAGHMGPVTHGRQVNEHVKAHIVAVTAGRDHAET